MGEFGGNIAGGLVIFAIIVIVIFLVCREIVCWYFKFNQNVALLTEIRDLLAAKGSSQSTTPPSERATRVPQKESPLRCPGCGANVVDAGSAFCTKCGSKL
jgi:hypothetical protein